MGGKNACIVTGRADLERAATGIMRSAFGLSGQKCSALSRVYVDAEVADALIEKLQEKIAAIKVGDPTEKANWMGPVTTSNALQNYRAFCLRLTTDGGRILCGGEHLTAGELKHGLFVAPTLAEAPATHPLFQEEMFLPIVMLCRVADREEAMHLANDSPLGLTAGCYGSDDESPISSSISKRALPTRTGRKARRPAPGPVISLSVAGKARAATGKAIASFYYLAQYLREQSRTVVE